MEHALMELLLQSARGHISYEQVRARLRVDFQLTKEWVQTEIEAAIAQPDPDTLDLTISLLWIYDADREFLDLLNRLLLVPHHWSHQEVTRSLQLIASPSSIPFIRAALETDFHYLDYTASEPGAIAKWFSWALCAIGTPEAIQTIRDFTQQGRKGIRRQMRYRLRKMGLKP